MPWLVPSTLGVRGNEIIRAGTGSCVLIIVARHSVGVDNPRMSWLPMARYRWLGTAGASLAWVFLAASVWVFLGRETVAKSYFASSAAGTWLGFGAAVALLLAGSYAALVMASGPSALCCLAIGCAWLAPVWVGWEGGPPVVRAVAAIAPPLTVPLLSHVALSSSHGARWPVVLPVYLWFGVGAVVASALHQPIEDLHAFANLSDYSLAVPAPELARSLQELLRVSTVAVALALPPIVVGRALVRRSVGDAWLWLPALVALVLEGFSAWALLAVPQDRFDAEPGLTLFAARALVLCAVASGAWWVVWRRRAALRRMTRLIRDLAEQSPAGGFEHALRSTLGDPGLEVRYWIRQAREYADASGRAADTTPSGRAVARVVRGSDPVALVAYDPGRLGRRTLEQEIGAAARLAIDNERLRAESLAHLVELTESRARVVAAGDQERRRLERDLHDGVQQRLLAGTYELRLARADAAAAGQTVDVLDEAIAWATAALAELREFAHGVFPAVLDESGLEDALWSMADRSDVRLRLHCQLDGAPRAPGAERTAYLVAKAVLDSAVVELGLDVRRQDGNLVLAARGVGRVDVLHLSDLVGAAGGNVHHAGDRLEAVIPCAS